MLLFLWLLGAIGVAWMAKQSWRAPLPWFIMGVGLTPLGGSLVLYLANQNDWFRPKR
jgi:hypothetical protein